MEKRKIVIVSLVFVFFLTLLYSVGFFLRSKTKELPSLPSKPSPTEIPWQEYFNQEYRYVISYPSGWKVEAWDIRQAANLTKIPDGAIWHQAKFKGEKGSFEILIWENKTKAPLKSWLTWFRHEDLDLSKLPEKENFQVGGMPAILYPQEETARGPLDHIFFQWDNKVYEFIEEKETSSVSRAAYDKIVSSFHFLEGEVKVRPKAQKLVDLGREDLSKRLGVKKEEIRVLQIEEVDWPDTSLGCPQEGMFYAQVITPGFKITLEGRGKSYTYHSDYNRVILCGK